ncbi:hypothetical protein BDZ91DRAFT_43099 [Kalaharituber pfeilii]|nr:hypothetical protein BDZ91DRAFT_43099 [Kalaharituber pfeilii]
MDQLDCNCAPLSLETLPTEVLTLIIHELDGLDTLLSFSSTSSRLRGLTFPAIVNHKVVICTPSPSRFLGLRELLQRYAAVRGPLPGKSEIGKGTEVVGGDGADRSALGLKQLSDEVLLDIDLHTTFEALVRYGAYPHFVRAVTVDGLLRCSDKKAQEWARELVPCLREALENMLHLETFEWSLRAKQFDTLPVMTEDLGVRPPSELLHALSSHPSLRKVYINVKPGRIFSPEMDCCRSAWAYSHTEGSNTRLGLGIQLLAVGYRLDFNPVSFYEAEFRAGLLQLLCASSASIKFLQIDYMWLLNYVAVAPEWDGHTLTPVAMTLYGLWIPTISSTTGTGSSVLSAKVLDLGRLHQLGFLPRPTEYSYDTPYPREWGTMSLSITAPFDCLRASILGGRERKLALVRHLMLPMGIERMDVQEFLDGLEDLRSVALRDVRLSESGWNVLGRKFGESLREVVLVATGPGVGNTEPAKMVARRLRAARKVELGGRVTMNQVINSINAFKNHSHLESLRLRATLLDPDHEVLPYRNEMTSSSGLVSLYSFRSHADAIWASHTVDDFLAVLNQCPSTAESRTAPATFASPSRETALHPGAVQLPYSSLAVIANELNEMWPSSFPRGNAHQGIQPQVSEDSTIDHWPEPYFRNGPAIVPQPSLDPAVDSALKQQFVLPRTIMRRMRLSKLEHCPQNLARIELFTVVPAVGMGGTPSVYEWVFVRERQGQGEGRPEGWGEWRWLRPGKRRTVRERARVGGGVLEAMMGI